MLPNLSQSVTFTAIGCFHFAVTVQSQLFYKPYHGIISAVQLVTERRLHTWTFLHHKDFAMRCILRIRCCSSDLRYEFSRSRWASGSDSLIDYDTCCLRDHVLKPIPYPLLGISPSFLICRDSNLLAALPRKAVWLFGFVCLWQQFVA